ncbi:MAG: LptF/LptG family permease [Planctomycetia bacterium]|nr:LptF/LptG family permease [Planctomycetia bacterium]
MSNVPGHAVYPGLLRLLIIDRYLLRQFWHSFVICFCSLTGLYVVIDGFGNLEEFINYAQKHGSLLGVMGEYYAYRSLSFFDTTSHLLTLIAAMFTVTWIQRHNELTALEAAGIPRSRIIKPLVGAAIVIIVLSVANREWMIPAVRQHLSHNAQDLEGSAAKPLQARYDNETDVLLGGPGSQTFADQQRIHKPDFDFYLSAGLDRYGPRLWAEDAFYRPPRQGRPGGYLFVKIEQPKGLDQKPSLLLRDRPVLLTPYDTPWLKPGECFLASNISFEQLEAGTDWRQFASTLELIHGLRNRSLDYGADDRLAIHSRVVKPLLDITLLFLGLPLMLSRSNRNVFLAIGLCVGLVIAFMLVVLGCKYLGASYWFEPALAAWLPLMIFVPCAVAISQPLRQ